VPATSSSSRLPFLVLPENRFAHTAIIASDETAQAVFLYGPSGVGKTELATQAVEALLDRLPQSRVQHLTASQFAAEFAEASTNKTIPLFQSLTRQVDLLVIEDIHALEGRPETQTQLLSLTNELLSSDCRVIWTSHKSPGELKQFLPRLISRFRGGVLAALRLPGPESRRKLIEHFARTRHFNISPAALKLLADELAVSPRELLSALQRLTALARHDRRPVDSDLVRKFLAHDAPPQKLKIDDICRAVARQFGTTATELRSQKRSRSAALPRQCAMLLSRELTASSLERIGRFFGGRDHSTVVHACQRVLELVESEPDLRTHLNQIRHSLGVAPAEEEGCAGKGVRNQGSGGSKHS
jgi:chromosomal replication initiator protein